MIDNQSIPGSIITASEYILWKQDLYKGDGRQAMIKISYESGLNIATDTVAFATRFLFFATRKTRVDANLHLGFASSDTK